MIVMINGAFGAGKTTIAQILQTHIPNSMIFDPEEIGYMVRKIIPEEVRLQVERTDDFQDIELWRILTVKTVREVKRKYNKDLIIPMTIYKPKNFEYIFTELQNIENELYHFCLIASEETIYQRLASRGDKEGGWTYQQTKKCIETLTNELYKEHINTDKLSINEIINRILLKIK
ncbi:AAA family ATPase [Alkaliphilus serpentinus]|uniref:AAA family ATPase n=1 Tax=Alkaliphilus serpentinus TaxID=1482731 RepID=A0A833HNK6_9FIRM|nr:AAA family ATPase [Alkaliphilus serpentinus]KAB3529583.1 AAA family ATPase [Alkaliphilus serpentinus]